MPREIRLRYWGGTLPTPVTPLTEGSSLAHVVMHEQMQRDVARWEVTMIPPTFENNRRIYADMPPYFSDGWVSDELESILPEPFCPLPSTNSPRRSYFDLAMLSVSGFQAVNSLPMTQHPAHRFWVGEQDMSGIVPINSRNFTIQEHPHLVTNALQWRKKLAFSMRYLPDAKRWNTLAQMTPAGIEEDGRNMIVSGFHYLRRRFEDEDINDGFSASTGTPFNNAYEAVRATKAVMYTDPLLNGPIGSADELVNQAVAAVAAMAPCAPPFLLTVSRPNELLRTRLPIPLVTNSEQARDCGIHISPNVAALMENSSNEDTYQLVSLPPPFAGGLLWSMLTRRIHEASRYYLNHISDGSCPNVEQVKALPSEAARKIVDAAWIRVGLLAAQNGISLGLVIDRNSSGLNVNIEMQGMVMTYWKAIGAAVAYLLERGVITDLELSTRFTRRWLGTVTFQASVSSTPDRMPMSRILGGNFILVALRSDSEANYARCELCNLEASGDSYSVNTNSPPHRMVLCGICASMVSYECPECQERVLWGRWWEPTIQAHSQEPHACRMVDRFLSNTQHPDDIGAPSRPPQHPGDIIRSYSTDPDLRIRTLGDQDCQNPSFGLELEICVKTRFNKYATAQSVNQYWGPDAVSKNDGSLPENGFEIAASPGSLKWNRAKWYGFLTAPVVKELYGWDCDRAGLHIHIGRAGLGQLTIARLVPFFNKPANYDWIAKIVGRSANTYATVISAKKMRDAFTRTFNRYETVNIANSETVEIRQFKSSANWRRVLSYLDFSAALIDFCSMKCLPQDEMESHEAFVEWIKGKGAVYPFLYNRIVHGPAYMRGDVPGEFLEPWTGAAPPAPEDPPHSPSEM